MRLLFPMYAGHEIVKDMEVTFPYGKWMRYSGTFQVVFDGFKPFQLSAVAELQFGVIAEPRGVVARQRMCVAERFQDELRSVRDSLLGETHLGVCDL